MELHYESSLLSRYEEEGRSKKSKGSASTDATAPDPGRYPGVVSIDTPVGRFEYEYHHPRPDELHIAELRPSLVKVTYPSTNTGATPGIASNGPRHVRLYHYENSSFPTLLTGISIESAGTDGKPQRQRISTWGYDSEGRGNLSVKGLPAKLQTGPDGKPLQPYRLVEGTGIDQVVLQHGEPKNGRGETIAINALGQKTVFTWGQIDGKNRLLEVRGAGCAHCPGPNERYGYDRFARLTDTTHLTLDGRPIQTIRTELDLEGRTRTVSRIDYLNGKPQPPVQLAYYSYDDTTSPTFIERPSVIAGKQHTTRITYNKVNQPVSVVETGFNPIDEKGNPTPNGTPISRTTTYSYGHIGQRSVLTQIDGPLPNGPKNSPEDSDITRVQWDEQGSFITAITSPMNLRASVRVDDAGRIAEVMGPSGITDRYRYAYSGEVTAVTRWLKARQLDGTSYRRDALGQLIEVLEQAGDKQVPRTRQAFDAAGRLLWQADALGILRQATYDPEGKLLASTVASATMRQEERYAYDAEGRLIQTSDSSGAVTRMGYDERGALQSLTDPLGRVHQLAARVDAAAPTSSKQPERAQQPPSRQPRPRQLADDFGRVVATIDPDSGTTIHRFDEADRLIAEVDAQGNQSQYEHDAAGRIERQRISDKATGRTDKTTWQYAGTRLVALEHPTQSERYEHDERGRLVARIVKQRLDDGGELTSVTRYAYDDSGALQSVSLPDGSRVQYERNGQGQVVAVQRERIQTPWLRWLLPVQTVVKELERDLKGPKRYVAGNGIEARAERSREALLARTVYRNTRQPVTAYMPDLPGLGSAHAAVAASPASSAASSVAATQTQAATDLPGALGRPADPRAFIDHRYLWDAQGNLLYTQNHNGTQEFAYDAHDRLIATTQALPEVTRTTSAGMSTSGTSGTSGTGSTSVTSGTSTRSSRYYYDTAGRRVLSQEDVADQSDIETNTRKAMYEQGTHRWLGADANSRYDVSGQLARVGAREYKWDATGRLIEVRQQGSTLASYRYSHRGERIGKRVGEQFTGYLYEQRQLSAELDSQGRITRQYLYLADTPVAVIDSPQGKALDIPGRGVLEQLSRDLQTVLDAWLGRDGQIAWLHANHLGAVEAVTDEQARIVWQASYEPFGAVRVGSGAGRASNAGFVLNLRLPGQYEDAETGLFYNGYRYYDPQRGEYLSPDPLGHPDGPNPYAYVRHNPLKYVDPDGLVLFAFDGTDNTDVDAWLNAHNSSKSNVVRFSDAYDDGRARYVTGVGTDHAGRDNYGDIIAANFTGLGGKVPDRGGNYSGPARIDRMIRYFAEEADAVTNDNEVMQVDIVGFSRGAAEARDFANRLVANTRNGWYRYENQTGQVDPKALPIVEKRCQRVNFRFMGLWDTVLSTNRSGTAYNLGIPAQFSHVAQAVALNEYRSAPEGVNASVGALGNFRYWNNTRSHLPENNHYGAFPLESIGASSNTPGRVRIERGFIGAHADIGGGYGANENGLSTVALSWMVAQAQIAGVKMETQDIKIDMNNPVIHDQSNALRVGNPLTTPNFRAPGAVYGTNTYAVEDRQVNGGLGGGTQRTQTFGAPEPGGNRSMTNADTHGFINYTPRNTVNDTRRTTDIPEIRNLHNRTGTVDMQNYMNWLRQHGYVFAGE